MAIFSIIAFFPQFKHSLFCLKSLLSGYFLLAIIVRSAVAPTTHFAKFVSLVEVTICWISSIFLSPEYKRGAVVISKSSCSKSRATTRVILSQIICYSVTADWRRWTSCFTSATMVVAFFSYPSSFTTRG